MDQFISPPSVGLPPKVKAKSATPASLSLDNAESGVPMDEATLAELKKEVDQFLADNPEYKADEEGLYSIDVSPFPNARLTELCNANYIDPFTVPLEYWLEQSEKRNA